MSRGWEQPQGHPWPPLGRCREVSEVAEEAAGQSQCFPFPCGWLRPRICSYPCAGCPAPRAEPAQCQSLGSAMGARGLCCITRARAVPGLGHDPQRLWGAHGCCGAHGAIGTAPTPRFLDHSRAGRQLCRDFAFSSTLGVFQCLFSYGAAPVLLSRALPEVPPARRVLQLCQTCHRLGRGTVLVPPKQLAQRA